MGRLIRAAGEHPALENAVYGGPMAFQRTDLARRDRPPRPCSRCGKRFQPTIKRLKLCLCCFRQGRGCDE